MAAVLVAAVALLSSCASATRPASAAPLPCRATGLTASGGRQGDGPGAQGDIEFTNTGRRPCLLRGVPQIAVVRAAGMTPLPVRARPPLYPLGPQAVLPPGQPGAGWLVVFWTNWCGPSPGPLRLQISLPDHGGTLDSPFDGPPDYDFVPACLSRGAPSTIAVTAAWSPPDGSGAN